MNVLKTKIRTVETRDYQTSRIRNFLFTKVSPVLLQRLINLLLWGYTGKTWRIQWLWLFGFCNQLDDQPFYLGLMVPVCSHDKTLPPFHPIHLGSSNGSRTVWWRYELCSNYFAMSLVFCLVYSVSGKFFLSNTQWVSPIFFFFGLIDFKTVFRSLDILSLIYFLRCIKSMVESGQCLCSIRHRNV